ncbi:lactate utilization protein C [Paraburkholderia sp. CNPSo 3157]|uniref:Lactate utilization protein C n=1 Tax=Paraburkholderia franconis TaxID=2654983 RepID=A0A7X1N7B5_9BURK|nr:lactate utilization protein C [Paraburkholderia franconis]MPW16702.1 lactate utilization protein C [Paraburkholderia franconis]
MNARERMLGRLRAAAPTDVSSDELKRLDARIDLHYDRRRAARPAVELSTHALVESMQAALAASHAEVFRATARTWPALIAQRLADANAKRVLLDTLRAEGAALQRALPLSVATHTYDRPIENWKAELFETIDAGFTVARSGIASTGTLIVSPDAGSPRTMSLVPPLHIALVYADSLHTDLHAAMRAEQWQAGMPTNLVLVSGPSKTSDIQQTLAYGAHGPRELWVVIVEREANNASDTHGDAA